MAGARSSRRSIRRLQSRLRDDHRLASDACSSRRSILYFLGSGPVRGFAVSLGLGILTTIITAVTMTRMMISLWYRYARPTRLPI
jgi:hypothetical protein